MVCLNSSLRTVRIPLLVNWHINCFESPSWVSTTQPITTLCSYWLWDSELHKQTDTAMDLSAITCSPRQFHEAGIFIHWHSEIYYHSACGTRISNIHTLKYGPVLCPVCVHIITTIIAVLESCVRFYIWRRGTFYIWRRGTFEGGVWAHLYTAPDCIPLLPQ